MKINPTVKSFLNKNEEITLIGIFWSCYWRFLVVVYGIIFAAVVVFAGLGALLGS